MSTANAAAIDNELRDMLELINCLVAAVTARPAADTEYVGELLDRLRTRSNDAYESFLARSAERPTVVRGVSGCMI